MEQNLECCISASVGNSGLLVEKQLNFQRRLQLYIYTCLHSIYLLLGVVFYHFNAKRLVFS